MKLSPKQADAFVNVIHKNLGDHSDTEGFDVELGTHVLAFQIGGTEWKIHRDGQIEKRRWRPVVLEEIQP